MKKLSYLLLFVLVPCLAFAQTGLNPTALATGSQTHDEFKSVYIELISTTELSTDTEEIIIRFGSGEIFEKLKKETLKYKDTEKLIVFGRVIDALNYLAGKGWAIRNSTVMPMGDKIVQHYLLEKYVDLSKYKK